MTTTAHKVPCIVQSLSSPYAGMPTEVLVHPDGYSHSCLYLADDRELTNLTTAMLAPDGYRYAVREDLLIPLSLVRALSAPDVTCTQEEDQ